MSAHSDSVFTFGDEDADGGMAASNAGSRRSYQSAGESSISGSGHTSGSHAGGSGKRVDQREYVCAFWLQGELYALDVHQVGEVFLPDRIRPVPLAPDPVIGICNLRGTALAVVDLCTVLDLPRRNADDAQSDTGQLLVLQCGSTSFGARIDRVEGVFPFDRDRWRPGAPDGEHPAIRGMFTLDKPGEPIASQLDTERVESALRGLLFKTAAVA